MYILGVGGWVGGFGAGVNVCVIIILSIGNTQISMLILCFLYLFVELMITMNEYILFKPKRPSRISTAEGRNVTTADVLASADCKLIVLVKFS